MNKQEAIEVIKNIDTLNINDMIAGQSVDMVIKNQVIDIISQIDEPQKVVVQKFVAEWLEWCKENSLTLSEALSAKENKSDDLQTAVNEWFTSNHEDLFARAWLFGYEIEREKLYTVEIPDPNRPDTVTFLYKENGKVFIGSDIFLDEVPNYKWKKDPDNQLTESEIKQDFEWAWQWAKPVEEN